MTAGSTRGRNDTPGDPRETPEPPPEQPTAPPTGPPGRYLDAAQIEALLTPIDPGRVLANADGDPYVEAYEVRAMLTRIFGFARWNEEALDHTLVFESHRPLLNPETGTEDGTWWTVCYRSRVRLTVTAPDGTVLCRHTQGGAGTQSGTDRGRLHHEAVATADSMALKRCAKNLGEQFGLSLYGNRGGQQLVGGTLVGADGTPAYAPDTPPGIVGHGAVRPVPAGVLAELAEIDALEDPGEKLAAYRALFHRNATILESPVEKGGRPLGTVLAERMVEVYPAHQQAQQAQRGAALAGQPVPGEPEPGCGCDVPQVLLAGDHQPGCPQRIAPPPEPEKPTGKTAQKPVKKPARKTSGTTTGTSGGTASRGSGRRTGSRRKTSGGGDHADD
ncbi:MAG: hypothetical protein J2P26_04265 [Nocardiopsaceae bacterium]|nr:hypothetical protein [Nocardiopsaceae bacterium]